MTHVGNRLETDPAVCGKCGGLAYVRESVRFCSACGRTTVGCLCGSPGGPRNGLDHPGLRQEASDSLHRGTASKVVIRI